MQRRHLLLLLALVVIALALTLSLMRNELAPEQLQREATPESVAPRAADSTVVGDPTSAIERQSPPVPPLPSTESPVVPKPALTGIVKESDYRGPLQHGVPDVLVEVLDKNGITLLATTTDEHGAFAFERLSPEAQAIATRPAPAGLPRLRHDLLGRNRRSEPPTRITLWRPPALTITGIVIDVSGNPVAGAIVGTNRPYAPLNGEAGQVLEGEAPARSAAATTMTDGRFELQSCPRGLHLLRAECGGRSGSVQASANDAGVVIRLGSHFGTITVTGQLTDMVTGAPIAGAEVWMRPLRRSKPGGHSMAATYTTTDQQGRYELQGLVAGTYSFGSLPDGFAKAETEVECEARQHVVDLTLLPARSVRVRVLTTDGQPAKGIQVRVRDAAGKTVEVPGSMSILGDGAPVDASGIATLRRLPAAPLTLLAVHGDGVIAGSLELDLRTEAPPEVTIQVSSLVTKFARMHFFHLLDVDGKPATIEGSVVASSFNGDQLLSRVDGRWIAGRFCLGNDRIHNFPTPTIAVGAIAGACRVEIAAPGYQLVTLTLEPGAKSPTAVTLQR